MIQCIVWILHTIVKMYFNNASYSQIYTFPNNINNKRVSLHFVLSKSLLKIFWALNTEPFVDVFVYVCVVNIDRMFYKHNIAISFWLKMFDS